jgi:predicted 3-demethylubiquinone-9 3-methyltransferase (glyoxalase superfamily)
VTTHTITPFLWFDSQAEEAARLYTSVFPRSRITRIARYGEGAPQPAGSAMTVGFELDGLPFTALNGGPHFTFSEAISFVVHCANQAEVDRYWDALIAGGGEPSMCGWLKDGFGLSWQVTPRRLLEMTASDDRAAAERATKAMLEMTRIDIAQLEEAFRGEPARSR